MIQRVQLTIKHLLLFESATCIRFLSINFKDAGHFSLAVPIASDLRAARPTSYRTAISEKEIIITIELVKLVSTGRPRIYLFLLTQIRVTLPQGTRPLHMFWKQTASTKVYVSSRSKRPRCSRCNAGEYKHHARSATTNFRENNNPLQC